MSQLKKYRKIKYLGKGSYGAAILVELRADPTQKFVIKEIVIGHLKPTEQQSAKNEAEVLHQMNHSNITSYIESFVESSKLYIVMEHADGGDLSSAIQKKKTEGKYWQEEEVMRIFVQICLALKHVHNGNILHRDLKSQNIFLTQKGMVKLGDFGIAKVLDASDDQARTQIGTPYYLSPEICESKPYGRKSDVWSLGVVLYELLALEMPFQANSLPALVHRICSAEPNYSKLETKYSNALIGLCKSLLLKNPDARPEVGQIVRTDFIKDHISRLLSYTLKSGTGGVVGVPAQPAPVVEAQVDPDEADNRIEKYREREREQSRNRDPEAKEAIISRDRQQQADEARDKVRKIRQEMIHQNQQQQQQQPRRRDEKGYEGKEVDNYPQQRGGPVNRALSPKSAAIASARAGAGSVRQPNEPPRVNPFQRQNSNQPSSSQSPASANRIKSLAEIQGERQAAAYDNVVAVPSGGRGNENDYARREYFERRAAAQAVKAKVEAYERGGYDRGGGDGGGVTNAVALRQGRRPSDSEYENDNFSGMNPEQRIAMLKAQREKEKEREIAEQERQMKLAIEQSREERRRSENKPKAIAFDIDINSDRVEAKNVKVRGDGGVIADDFHSNKVTNNNNQRKATEDSSSRREVSNHDLPRAKKGWGPPVEASDIFQARGLQPPSSSVNNTPPSSKNKRLEAKESSNSDIEDFSNDVPGEDRATSNEDDEGNNEILKRIEYKRRSQLEVRHQAREVLSKLREQRQLQAKNRLKQGGDNLVLVGEGGGRANRKSPLRNRAGGDEKQTVAAASGSNKERRPSGTDIKLSDEGSRSNSRPRENNSERKERDKTPPTLNLPVVEEGADDLQDTLSNWLQEQKRAVTVRKKNKPNSPVPISSRSAEAKQQLLREEEGDDADLQDLIVHEDEDIHLYKSMVTDRQQHHYQYQQGRASAQDFPYEERDAVEEALLSPAYQEPVITLYDHDRPLKAKFIDGDDVEVVGMQCMLAKALMGDDDD